jgi:predicted nucleotidyltransferase
MVDTTVIKAVKYFEEILREKGLNISRLIVFGSSSTGSATTGSDIDLAVISDDFKDKDLITRVLLTKDAELNTIRKFRVPLDIITLTPEEFDAVDSVLLKNIRKGITVSSASMA